MTASEQAFLLRLCATFSVEAEEHLQAMSSLLMELEKAPFPGESARLVETVYREAHTLKGAARAVDLRGVETICQGLESVLGDWKRQNIVPSKNDFDAIHRSIDAIKSELSTPDISAGVPALVQEDEESARPFMPPDEPAAEETAEKPAAVAPVASEQERPAIPETVRISAAKLDARLLQAQDMLTLKPMAALRAKDIGRLTEKMHHWWKQWADISGVPQSARQPASGNSGTDAVLRDFLEWNCDFMRSLQADLETAASQALQDRQYIDRRIDELLEESKKLLMLPFSTIAGMFPKLVRDLCRDQGKECELTIKGGQVEVDKRILGEMKDALMHILRNSIDHGIETPEERTRLGKPRRAFIDIAVSQVNGSKVEITVTDDGAGINTEGLKACAVRKGLLSLDDAAKLSETDAHALMFQSEISTSPVVTAVSGRGLGMAIVLAKAEALGGHIAVDSKSHCGTTFRILLPLTIATYRGVLITVGSQTFVVPAINVERVMVVQPGDVHSVENRETVFYDGQTVSLARLGTVLGLEAALDGSVRTPVLLLHSAGQRIAFAVDEVLHEEEVLVKPLRKPLVRVPNISGATILGSGKVAAVLHVPDLMKSARLCGAPPVPGTRRTFGAETAEQRILVVEDSITSRMLLKGILESGGYQVRVAVDGMEAYSILREGNVDLVVSDVEMPRLNGFDLTARIRADRRLAELPVVLVTALESREERERGMDAGASAYIPKSGFDQNILLETVQRLI